MIRNSFSFLDKINTKTEQLFWNQGIQTWDDFISASEIKGISSKRKGYYDRVLKKSLVNLQHNNEAYFYDKIPLKETWRLYDYFKDDAIYLDIETSMHRTITMIGLYNGETPKVLVHGFNLNRELLEEALLGCKMIVTFNGACFDLPIINKYFNNILPAVPHLDLRFACSQIGLTGGLKKIEKEIGIQRAEEVQDVRGGDAILLWDSWKTTRDRKYLDLLVEYNKEDIINLKPLAEHVISKLKEKQNNYFLSLTSKGLSNSTLSNQY